LYFSHNLLFFFQAEDGIRDRNVTGVQTCALPISTAQPGNFSNAFSNEPRVSTSKSLVGSSRRIRLPPSFSVSARFKRLRSPPESTFDGFCWSGPLKPKADR